MTGQIREDAQERADEHLSPSREREREMSQDPGNQRPPSGDRSPPPRRSRSDSRRSRSPRRTDRRSRSSSGARRGYGSRSRSHSGGKGSKYNGRAFYGDERVTHVMEIQDDDASFILGAGKLNHSIQLSVCFPRFFLTCKFDFECMDSSDQPVTGICVRAGGRTKRKLSHVCGAELNIEERNGRTVLEMRGTKDTLERAKLYVGFVMQQRVGPVQLPPDAQNRDDLTIIEVPHECVGYVTGRKGAGLRSVEEEWNTLMFFTDLRSEKAGQTERLAIFGSQRARRGSELKVMSAVEQKMPGYFTDNITEGSSSNEGFDTDYVAISEKDYSYALGQRGTTRKKLARASGAILEYVGRIAFVAGTLPERMRAKQYLQWLCMQRTSFVHVDTAGRDDCEVVNLPLDAVAYVTGSKGSNLRRVEEETGTFIFLDGARGGGEERLLIFCYDADARRRARMRIEERIDEKLSGRAREVVGVTVRLPLAAVTTEGTAATTIGAAMAVVDITAVEVTVEAVVTAEEEGEATAADHRAGLVEAVGTIAHAVAQWTTGADPLGAGAAHAAREDEIGLTTGAS
ncbi:hypothetical protein Emed_005129 [Eimeria media]